MHKAQNLCGSETTGDAEQRVGRQITMSGAYIVSPCAFSTAKAIPCPANQLLLPLTHTTLGLDEGFSGWETLQGFFTQNKGPLSGSRLPEWAGGGAGGRLSPTAGMKGEGAKESRQEEAQKRQEGLREAGLSRKNISHQADQKEES